MNTSRPTKTLADYLVIAVSPALIMVMVHSVCFFLVEVFYRGEAGGGVRWVLFWFVLAVVLIARIGIEQGDGQAMLYGLALAVCHLALPVHHPTQRALRRAPAGHRLVHRPQAHLQLHLD